jgi:hypothetical protein
VVPGELPDVLLSPDVAVLERAVRERPDVAAAVLDQMHYGHVHTPAAYNGAVDGHDAASDDDRHEHGAGEPGDSGTDDLPADGADRVGRDRR